MRKTTFGRQGESWARTYLERKGFKFLCSNFKRVHGEVDLIMNDGSTLVFVEVKSRRSLQYGTPIEAVTLAKQKHIRYCADLYMMENGVKDTYVRFDVVEVLLLPGEGPRIRHIQNAF